MSNDVNPLTPDVKPERGQVRFNMINGGSGETGMSKNDLKPEKAGSEKRAIAERQEAEDAVKKNMERLRALRLEREAHKEN